MEVIMLNTRLTAARDVAAKLIILEEAIDTALVHASELTAALPQARSAMKLSTTVGHEAVQKVSVALVALVEAREAMVDAHHKLAEVKENIGLKQYAMGLLWKIPVGELSTAVNNDEARAA
jgi:hypothetical protein